MIKRLATFLFLLLQVIPFFTADAGEYIGLGGHGGLQYDVGNLGGLTGADYEGQHNVIFGLILKLDRDPFFFRTGADRTILMAEGRVLNGSVGKLETLKIQYTSIPMYGGVNFRIRERGKFYIGFGLAYIMGGGEIKTTDETVKINKNVFARGFITGVQLRAGNYIRVFSEWEYLSGRSEPVANTSTTNSWKDFSVDFTGHRIYMGVSYYIY